MELPTAAGNALHHLTKARFRCMLLLASMTMINLPFSKQAAAAYLPLH